MGNDELLAPKEGRDGSHSEKVRVIIRFVFAYILLRVVVLLFMKRLLELVTNVAFLPSPSGVFSLTTSLKLASIVPVLPSTITPACLELLG